MGTQRLTQLNALRKEASERSPKERASSGAKGALLGAGAGAGVGAAGAVIGPYSGELALGRLFGAYLGRHVPRSEMLGLAPGESRLRGELRRLRSLATHAPWAKVLGIGALAGAGLGAGYGALQKTAGVGWDLHGYSRDPDLPEGDAKAEAYRQAMAAQVGKYPKLERKKRGFFGRLWHGSKHAPATEEQKGAFAKAQEAYKGKHKAYAKKHGPAPMDSWEYRNASRVKLPRKFKTNYKLNSNIDAAGNFDLSTFTTDTAYSDKNRIRNLSKADLAKVLKKYQATGKRYADENPKDPYVAPGVAEFVAKAQALLKNPKMQMARLEWE